MRINRRLTGLAAVTVVTLGTAACGSAEAGTATQAAPPTPAEALLSSVPDEADGAYTFAAQGGCRLTFSGVHDAPGKASKTTIVQKIPEVGALTMSIMSFGSASSGGADSGEADSGEANSGEVKVYGRFSFEPASLQSRLGVPKGWMAIDLAKVPSFDEDEVGWRSTDALGARDVMKAASNVAQEGLKYTGTTDLTVISDDDLIIAAKTVKKLGDKAKAVPFEAVVDEATGNLSTMKINLPSGKACTITYGGYGKTRSLTEPNAKKATAQVYALLNS